MRHMFPFLLVVCLLVASGLPQRAGFAHEPGQVIGPPLAEPIRFGGFHVRLETVATGLIAPLKGVLAPLDPRMFVVDQVGILWAVNLTNGTKSVFLDVRTRLVTLGKFGPNTFDERGLLGVAFHPNYRSNGLLYTYASEPATMRPDYTTMIPPFPVCPVPPRRTTAEHQSVIAEWRVPNPSNPASVVNPASRRELLRIDEPQFNHNGGDLNFGPDGMLYISVGDGGGADDQDCQVHADGGVIGHQGNGNGQKLNTPLGKILRIDVDGRDSPNGQYGIPADNPFIGRAGALGEIWAFGFRNPFRFSFDSATGDLFVGDVGQNDIEEVDIVVKGGNYGWNLKEGTFFFDMKGFAADPTGFGEATLVDTGRIPTGTVLEDPIAEYDTHNEGHSVIGGFMYQGTRIPQLRDRYLFGDFSRLFVNRIGTDGRLFYLVEKPFAQRPLLQIAEFRLVGQERLGLALFGFGQDHAGEVYVLGNATGVPFPERTTGRNTGVVLRIAPANR